MEWTFETLPACLSCGSRKATKVFDRKLRGIPLVFVKCSECDLIYQNPRLSDKALADYFSSDTFIKDSDAADYDFDNILGYPDYFDWEASYTKTARLRLNKIAKYRPAPGNFLEIGGATGWFLAEARKRGYDVRGLDVSRSLAQLASTRHGFQVDVSSVEDFDFPAAQYDVVCSFGGISCWRDPVKALKNVKKTLKPGGVFALNRGNVDGIVARMLKERYFEFNHASLTIFADKTFRAILKQAGFRTLYERNEVQYTSLDRALTYLRMQRSSRMSRRLGIAQLTFPVIVFGTVFTICVPE